VAWVAFVAGVAVVFRTLWLPLAIAAAAVFHLQSLAPLRVGVSPKGVTVNSRLGRRLAQVPLEAVTAAGATYLDMTSIAARSPAGCTATPCCWPLGYDATVRR
jgi:hypothetical protein